MKPKSSRAQFFQGVSYALTIAAYLYVLTRLFDVAFDTPYVLMALYVGMYSYVAFNRYDITLAWRFFVRGSIGSRILLRWTLLAVPLLLFCIFTQYSQYFSRHLLLTWLATTPLLLSLLHYLVRYPLRRAFPGISQRRRAAVVFVNESSRQLARRLQESEAYELAGFFEDRELERLGGGIEGLPYLGKAQHLAEYARTHDLDVVFVVLPDQGAVRTLNLIEELGDTTVSVYYVPDFKSFNLLETQITEVEGVPMIEVAETPFFGADGLLKRVFDIAFAFFALIMLAPVMLGLAIAVKLSSPGPALFKQKRYGLNGKSYSVYKFRSMIVGEAKDRELKQATRGDPRITRVGAFIRRTSLDELPQFLNVLRGDMSVVGPRPHSVSHNELYRKEVRQYMMRHKVKPGITGWAQVHGLRGETAQLERMAERIKYDLEYIRNWSPGLDLRIILMTILVIFKDDNAY